MTGDMWVEASAFTDNWACAGGGGVSVASSSNVFVRHSWVMGNTAVAQGCLPDSITEWTLAAGGGIMHVRACVCDTCPSLVLFTLMPGYMLHGETFLCRIAHHCFS